MSRHRAGRAGRSGDARKRTVQGWPCLDQPDGCGCRCHAIAAAKAGRRAALPSDWRPEEDAYLQHRLDAGDTPEQARHALNERFGTTRTRGAVRHRITDLGRTLRDGWYSAREVERMLGLAHHTVARWHRDGLLPMTRHKHGHWWRVSVADLEAFVKAQAGHLFDPARVVDRRLRALAEVSARARTVRTA